MAMDEELRRRYLAALEIPLWLARRPLASQPPPTAAPMPAVADADAGSTADFETTALEPVANAAPWTDEAEWTPPIGHGEHEYENPPMTATDTAEPEDQPAPTATQQRAERIAALDWPALEAEVRQCTACGLCQFRTQTVFGVGDRQADWLVIGEAPGADEDRQGQPFVGRAGKLLTPMLQAVGFQREQVFVSNILKCRPPENRDPSPVEALQCRPFLERQIALLQPRIILAVGRIAAHNLLNTEVQIGRLRGQIHHFGPERIPLVVTYHPAYLLRSPREKRKAWDDLRLARRAWQAAL